MRIGGATIFRFDLEQGPEGRWRGTWTRPESFAGNGAVFMRLRGQRAVPSLGAQAVGGTIELSFPGEGAGARAETFRFRETGAGRAQLIYVGTEFAPYPLVQVAPQTPLGPFEDGRIYDRDHAQEQPDPGQPLSSAQASSPPVAQPAPRIEADLPAEF